MFFIQSQSNMGITKRGAILLLFAATSLLAYSPPSRGDTPTQQSEAKQSVTLIQHNAIASYELRATEPIVFIATEAKATTGATVTTGVSPKQKHLYAVNAINQTRSTNTRNKLPYDHGLITNRQN